MKIPFWKMHGAANDFILVDDRPMNVPAEDKAWIARMAARRTGVGAEGLILIQPSTRADFRMRFFNPDGGEAEMCGNGARCVARLAYALGAAPETMTIETVAGPVGAEIRGEAVLLRMTPPTDWRMNRQLEVDGQVLDYHFVNTGVPHAVILVDDLDRTDVRALGARVRYHADFAPAGTNVNFVRRADDRTLRVRTYERGVEDETPACGTGITACGLVAGRAGWLQARPVRLVTAGGYTLEVDYRMNEAGEAEAVTLLGPAEHVFTGELTYPG